MRKLGSQPFRVTMIMILTFYNLDIHTSNIFHNYGANVSDLSQFPDHLLQPTHNQDKGQRL